MYLPTHLFQCPFTALPVGRVHPTLVKTYLSCTKAAVQPNKNEMNMIQASRHVLGLARIKK